MSINTIWSKVKELYPEYVILMKIGKFYSVYNRDSYIIAYLFKYQIKRENGKLNEIRYSCGFPDSAKNKIISKLEEKKINYLILDRRNNYEEDEKSDNKNLNTYSKIMIPAKKYANNRIRLDNIYDYFLENICEDTTRKMLIDLENKINETREV